MRRTLAALVLAITPPLTVLAVSGVQAQQVVTVRTGETLSEIAERHGVSLSRLMQANGIAKPDHVEIGQRLTIPGSGSTARSASTSSGSQGTAPYTVKSDETLSEIADRFNTTTARLIQINRIGDPDLVMSGTRLQVPVTAQRSSPAAAVNRNASEHVVQSGENLSLIAERYGTSVSRLVALNQLEDPELVAVGSRLKLRGTPPAARSTPPAATKPKPAANTSAAQPVAAQQAPVQQAAAQTASGTAQPSGTATTPATTTTAITPAATTAATTATTATTSTAATVTASTVTASTVTAAATTTATTAAQPALTAARGATTAATSAATAATRSPLATATAAAPLSGAATAAASGAAATAATTSAISRSAPVSAASRAPSVAPTTTTVASSTAAGRPTPANAARPAGEWRNYGPLQVDWSKIQPMGGSYVAPSLNGEGQPLYLAVNCTARKINVTSQAGQWRTWENPSKDFEHKLVQDICQANRS
jgi:LysM repeat protein